MRDPKDDLRARLGRGPVCIGQLVAHKVHGCRFIFFAAVHVLIGNRPDFLTVANLDPDLIFYADQVSQPTPDARQYRRIE